MKTKIIVIVITVLFSMNINAQIKIKSSNGYIGIGTSNPSYPVDARGIILFNPDSYTNPNRQLFMEATSQYGAVLRPYYNNSGLIGLSSKALYQVWSYSYSSPSDARQKENIRDITNALDLVLALKGVRFDYKEKYFINESLMKDEKIKAKLEVERKNKIGFIAQDLNKVLPEIVVYDDSADIYAIDYSKIVPVLVEAIKEQNKKIEELEKKINDSQPTPKSAEGEMAPSNSEALLGQNIPNPFNENTTIEFYLPSTVQIANFYVYDLQGKQIKSMNVIEREHGNIVIHGSELMPGMYYYSLIADGKVIGTEKMVLTD